MPKISILILLLELNLQIGLIGGLTNISLSPSGYAEILHTLSSDNTLQSYAPLIVDGYEDLSLIGSSFFNSIYTKGDVSLSNLFDSLNLIYLLKNLFLISSLLSLIIGTVVGLAQEKIKRLLAYSTISHIGFILLSLAINTEQSIDSLVFYIIQYSITNLNFFFILIALSYILNKSAINSLAINFGPEALKGRSNKKIFMDQFSNAEGDFVLKDIKYISDLKGQYLANPFLSLGLTICLFSFAGIPPLIGFFSKQYVLYSAVQSGYYFMAIVAIVVSVISASYYLKIIKVLHSPSDICNEVQDKNNDVDTVVGL